MRKLTLLIEDDIYEGLHRVAGRGQIGKFVSEKVRPHLAPAKTGSADQAFGVLRHLARRRTTVEVRSAQRDYMVERWKRKLRNSR